MKRKNSERQTSLRTVLLITLGIVVGFLMGMVAPTPKIVTAPNGLIPPLPQFLVVDQTECRHSPALYCTIQSAIDAAPPGSTIQVKLGVYAENLSIDKNLILQGETDQQQLPVINPEWGDTIRVTNADLHLSGFTIMGMNTGLVTSGGDMNQITLENVVFQTDALGDGDGIEIRAGLQHRITLGNDVIFQVPGTALQLTAGSEHAIEILEGVVFQQPHEAIMIRAGSKHLITIHAGVDFVAPETAFLITAGSNHVIDARAVRVHSGYMEVQSRGSVILGYETR